MSSPSSETAQRYLHGEVGAGNGTPDNYMGETLLWLLELRTDPAYVGALGAERGI
jgi:hypothetical protein